MISAAVGHALFTVRNLNVQRGGRIAIDDLSIDIPQSGVIGIFGPNGAGKTTLMEVLAGRLGYNSGDVKMDGLDLIDHRMLVRRRVSFASVPSGIARNLSGADYLNLVGAAEGYNPLTTRQVEMIRILQMQDDLSRRISGYSHGMQKKLSIIASLNEQARVYVFDEIFNGLDIVSLRALRAFFRDLAASGKLICICSHFLQILFDWCDEVVLIAEGTVRRRWSKDEIDAFNGYTEFEEAAIKHYPAGT